MAGVLTVLLGSLLGTDVCWSEVGLAILFIYDRVDLVWGN